MVLRFSVSMQRSVQRELQHGKRDLASREHARCCTPFGPIHQRVLLDSDNEPPGCDDRYRNGMLSVQIAPRLEAAVSASTLLRSARHAGNLSQRALAELADTSGPTVAAYETGSKDPRTSTLLRLLAAAGLDVQVVARRPRADRFRDLLAAAIAEKIVAEPTLLDRAREVMDGGVWRSDYEGQWRALMAAGPAAVIGVLTSPHPDTLALKADSPFTMLGLVEAAERQRLLEAAYAT